MKNVSLKRLAALRLAFLCLFVIFASGCAPPQRAYQNLSHSENARIKQLTFDALSCSLNGMERAAEKTPPKTYHDVIILAEICSSRCEYKVYAIKDYMESISLNRYAIDGYIDSLRGSFARDVADAYIQRNGL